MRPALWSEIHRLADFERLSQREIAKRLSCSRDTVCKAMAMARPPAQFKERKPRESKLAPFKQAIQELLTTYPDLSGVRVEEELRKLGYTGGKTILCDYLHRTRSRKVRVYQPVQWRSGEAMQLDWGDCAPVRIGTTERKVSVFVAALCYSRALYIEFTLDQKKETFYRCLGNALSYFGGSPQRVIVDNLKAAVLSGHGRTARFHPEFLDICGYYRMQAVACQRRDPESKGMVENGVRYVKHNALAGRSLTSFEEYTALAKTWRDAVNVRIHRQTGERPVDRLKEEALLPLPEAPYDTRRVCQCVADSHAYVGFETNRYSVPPEVAHQPVTLKADDRTIWIYFQAREVARHERSYDRKALVSCPAHQQAALTHRKQDSDRYLATRFDELGPAAITFADGLARSPHQPLKQKKKILHLSLLYSRQEVILALEAACTFQTFDASYVENLIQQNRRRLALPSPLPLTPMRRELLETIDMEEPDLTLYDQLIEGGSCEDGESDEE